MKLRAVTNESTLSIGRHYFVGNARRLNAYKLNVYDLAAFVIPFTQFLEIKLVGNLYAPEVLLALMLPVLLVARGKLLRERAVVVFIVLGVLWLANQIIADMVRQSSFQDYVRGWALIVFTLVDFSALYLLLVGRRRRILLYAIGLVAGAVVNYFVNRSLFAQFYPWKFGYGDAVTLAFVLFATIVQMQIRGKPLLPALVVFVAGLINLFMDYRALSGICFLAGAYLLIQAYFGRPGLRESKIKLRNTLLVGLLVCLASVGIFKGYGYAASTGLLGVQAQRKYEAQAMGEYGLIIGGRSELLVSVRAITDSPIVGYGSWPTNCYFSRLEMKMRTVLGYGNEGSSGSCLLPTHSFVFGAWVSAGILGAVFWIWVLTVPFNCLLRLYRTLDPMTPLIVFFGFNIAWAIIFSPYASEELVTVPFYIVVLMECYRHHLGQKRIKI